MNDVKFALFDIVEMKKPHPCINRSKLFQIVRVGADYKIRCLGCGNYIMLPYEIFIEKVKMKIDVEIDSKYLEK